MVEMLRGVVATASVMLSQKEGDAVEVVETIGGIPRVLHNDGNRICACFR